MIKYPDKNNLREKGFLSAHSPRPLIVAGSQGRGPWRQLAISQPVRKEGDECMRAGVQLCFLTHLRNYCILLVYIVHLCVHTAHMWRPEDSLWE